MPCDLADRVQTQVMFAWQWVGGRFQDLLEKGRLEWAALTRPRDVDAIVGRWLLYLVLIGYLLPAAAKHLARCISLSVYTAVLRAATVMGFVPPMHLVGDDAQVRNQLENPTVTHDAHLNSVLLKESDHGSFGEDAALERMSQLATSSPPTQNVWLTGDASVTARG